MYCFALALTRARVREIRESERERAAAAHHKASALGACAALLAQMHKHRNTLASPPLPLAQNLKGALSPSPPL